MIHPNMIKLDSIEDAIKDIKNGKVIIVVDDENRENEGDFVAAAEITTPEIINFMAQYGRGLICTPLTEERCKKLHLNPMVDANTDPMGTAFTISVDLNGEGVTSGISASDRAKTVRALVNTSSKPTDFIRPGHVFPLTAKEGGVLRRTGHTEAAIDFARLAGFQPAGVIVEIMNEDGSMARLPELRDVADKFNLKLVSIDDLISYRMKNDSLIELCEDFQLKTRFGEFRLRAYQQNTNDQIHIALTLGEWNKNEAILTRIHSLTTDNDLLSSLTNSEDRKLDPVFNSIKEEGQGAILFINQNPLPENLLHRLGELRQIQNGKKIAAPPILMDEKDFGIGAQMLHQLNIHNIRLLSNSEKIKRVGISGYGLSIVDYVQY